MTDPVIIAPASYSMTALGPNALAEYGSSPVDLGVVDDGSYLATLMTDHTTLAGWQLDVNFPSFAAPFLPGYAAVYFIGYGMTTVLAGITGGTGAALSSLPRAIDQDLGATYIDWTDLRDLTDGLSVRKTNTSALALIAAVQLWLYPRGAAPPLRLRQRSDGAQ